MPYGSGTRSVVCSATRAVPRRLAWAVAGMIVYAVGSAGLAYLIRPIFDNVLPEAADVSLHRVGDRRCLPAEGRRLLRVLVPDGRRRPARRHGPSQRAVSAHPRPVGGLLRPRHDRAADVADQQRRRRRCSRPCRKRLAIWRASRWRWSGYVGAVVLLRRAADDRLPDRRAAHRVSARSGWASACGGPPRRSQEALEQLSHLSAEAFTGHRIVKAFGTERHEAEKFNARRLSICSAPT